jgi:hypothetical protein
VAVAGCGSGKKTATTQRTFTNNARNWSGAAHPLAVAVDQLAAAARAGDTATICGKLFTPALDRVIAARATGKTCAAGVRTNLVSPNEDITVRLAMVKAKTARVVVREQNGKQSVLLFVRQAGAWRINSISPLKAKG